MKKIFQAAAVTLFAASTAQAQQAVQWKVSDGGNGHWYLLAVNGKRSWTDARTWAMSIGGHLATFQTQAEWNVIWQKFDGSNGYWIGLFQDPPTGLPPDQGWRWVTNEPLDFTAWGVEEPNDWIGYQQWVAQAGNAYWDDTIETGLQVPVVEWDADCNTDGIVDYGQCHDGTLADYNGNNIPDCCERGEPCMLGHYPVQWRVSEGGNGHWYRGSALASGGYSRASALAEARSLNGDLVCFSSQAERDFVTSNVLNDTRMWVQDGGTTYGPWTGAFLNSSCQWEWTSGEPFTYAPWAWGEPDSGCGWAGNNYGCLACKGCGPQPSLPTQLIDLGGNFPLAPGLIIEWSADCNNDGIVDYGQILQGQLADTNSDGVPDICQQPTCRDADLFRNGVINGADLGILLSEWGPANPSTVSDITRDGVVDGADLGLLLSFWGACS
jgi:hypothetical protein